MHTEMIFSSTKSDHAAFEFSLFQSMANLFVPCWQKYFIKTYRVSEAVVCEWGYCHQSEGSYIVVFVFGKAGDSQPSTHNHIQHKMFHSLLQAPKTHKNSEGNS